ncbi:hypothetical protein YPPY03_3598, partial [Yersinia pestis PY-03]
MHKNDIGQNSPRSFIICISSLDFNNILPNDRLLIPPTLILIIT